MDTATGVGYVAGTMTVLAFVPQVWKTWRSRSAADVSLAMYLIFAFGVFLWIVYGLVIHSIPVVAANAATFILACTMIVFKGLF
jgi:MtN3 and saliva related transmembrane protein